MCVCVKNRINNFWKIIQQQNEVIEWGNLTKYHIHPLCYLYEGDNYEPENTIAVSERNFWHMKGMQNYLKIQKKQCFQKTNEILTFSLKWHMLIFLPLSFF